MFFNEDLSSAMNSLTANGAFLSAKGGGITNTMTISWGLVGVIWGKPHFIALVRPQRHTLKALDAAEYFTVSIPRLGEMKEELAICGSKSGADIDKGAVVEFAPSKVGGSVVVKNCGEYLECKIDYRARLDGDAIPGSVKATMYNGDYHMTIFGEIVERYGE